MEFFKFQSWKRGGILFLSQGGQPKLQLIKQVY